MTGSIDFFTKHFGTFQYPNCSIVAVGKQVTGQGFGLENPSMIVVGSIVDAERKAIPGYNRGSGLISHEVGHMWFGNPVSVKEWKDIWLAEGLTTYAELLYMEQSSPTYDRNFDFAATYEWIKELEAEGKSLGPLIRSTYDDLFDSVVYYRGALAIYALENEIGRDATLAILRSWVDRYRNRMVTTEDFINHVTDSTRDPDVKPLLMRWIYDTYMPPFPGAPVQAQELTAVKAASFNERAIRSSRAFWNRDSSLE
jgi:aminopeptidase N